MIQPDQLTPLSPRIGAIIKRVDLNKLEPADVAFISDALQQHLVLFFNQQSLDPTGLRNLAALFGNPTPYPFVPGLPELPEVIEVIKRPEDHLNFGGVWHSDTAYLENPAKGAMLYAVEIPEQGGDTIFTNMHEVFDVLSPGLQRWLRRQQAVNDADSPAIAATRSGAERKQLSAVHPVVARHPKSGRELLYINRAHTTHFAGMTAAESKPVLEYLFDLIEAPQFSCRFRRVAGSLAFWDNRACQHYPINDYPGHLRKMLRVSLAGESRPD